MHRFFLSSLLLLILLSALCAEDKPKEEKLATPAAKYQALVLEFTNALKEADALFLKARTDDERKTIRANFHKWRVAFVGRVLDFAEKHPTDKEAVDALFFVLHCDTHAEPADADRAIKILLEDHTASASIGSLLRLIAEYQQYSFAEKPIRQVLAKNPHPAMQAHASLALGDLLLGKASSAPPEQATKLIAEAEELFDRVVTKYADVKDVKGVSTRYSDMASVIEEARAELNQIRHLAVSKTMPDIQGKDSAGKEFKLSDYRGKVVVLDFWATWCPPCMAMTPHNRLLVKRLEGKPFALLGVNRDASREALQTCEAKQNINWRSFFDGTNGPISKQHNIKRMPTIYVLDARGVIRFVGLRGEALDKAVNQLLAEMAAAK